MSGCTINPAVNETPRREIRVDGVVIPHHEIAAEAQNHRASSPAEAFREAARALIVKKLLLEEARRLDLQGEPEIDEEGRIEAEEDRLIRLLIDRAASVDLVDEEACRAFHAANKDRFRAPDLYEASHILVALAPGGEAAAQTKAGELASAIIRGELNFETVARAVSACPSRELGGSLGQVTKGENDPAFEAALDELSIGEVGAEPVRTRFGYHIIRLDRRLNGDQLPYERVRSQIASYLEESARRAAIATFIGNLVRGAEIDGIDLSPVPRQRTA